jgi:hypothetical protein
MWATPSLISKANAVILPEKQQVVGVDRIAPEAGPPSVEDGVARGVGVSDFGESVREDPFRLNRHEIRPGPR